VIGGDDETRARDLCRDSLASLGFTTTYKTRVGYYEQPCSSSRLQLRIFCEAQEFSRHILRIRSRTSREMVGRPGLPLRTFQVQNKRKPARCQATTVSGLTMASDETPVMPEVG